MAFDPKVRIREAISGKQKINKSHDAIFTQDFGFPSVVMFDELIPDTAAQVKPSLFSRLAPMVVPTFGDVRVELNAFFIPLRLLQPGINDRINNSFYATSSGLATSDRAHYTTNLILASSLASLSTPVAADQQNFDFMYGNQKYVFSDYSKRMYFLLNSLGYGVNFSSQDETQVSMLPLLAFARVYCDYLVPQNYRKSTIDQIQRFFVCQDTKAFTKPEVTQILNFTYLAIYDPDYFTSAWQDNNSPGSDFKAFTSEDPFSTFNGNQEASVQNTKDAVKWNILGPTGSEGADETVGLSDYGFQLWQNVTNRVKRMNYTGSRWFDRLLAEIGIMPKYAHHDQCQFLGSYMSQIQISDVMATAGTSDNNLGDYAGKGIGYFSGNSFHVETDEPGYLMILSTIRPRIQYYQGRDRLIFHIKPNDFWHGDQDNQGNQAIRNDELYSNFCGTTEEWTSGQSYGLKPDGIFGFAPRYSEYAYKGAKVIGDFQVKTLNTGLDAYHLFRTIPMPKQNAPLVLDEQFVTMGDATQYSRIFQVKTAGTREIDHFYNTYHFDYTWYSPKKSINDHTDIGIEQNKDIIEIRNGGRHV